MAYASLDSRVFDNMADGVPLMTGIAPHEASAARVSYDQMNSPTITGCSGLFAMMAKFDEPVPTQPLINHAQIETDLEKDHSYYTQSADFMKNYWGVPVAPAGAPTPNKALDSVADFLGGAMDGMANSMTNTTVSTSSLSGALNHIAQKPDDLTPNTPQSPYRNNRPTL